MAQLKILGSYIPGDQFINPGTQKFYPTGTTKSEPLAKSSAPVTVPKAKTETPTKQLATPINPNSDVSTPNDPYLEMIGKAWDNTIKGSDYKPYQAGEIVGDVKAEKGILNKIGAVLGGLGKYSQTAEGQQAMSGLVKNPYAKRYLLEQSARRQPQENEMRMAFEQQKQAQLKNYSELAKEHIAQKAAGERADKQLAVQLAISEAELAQRKAEFAQKRDEIAKEMSLKLFEIQGLDDKEKQKEVADKLKKELSAEDYIRYLKDPEGMSVEMNPWYIRMFPGMPKSRVTEGVSAGGSVAPKPNR
jgi:hypothetical protein